MKVKISTDVTMKFYDSERDEKKKKKKKLFYAAKSVL